MAVGVGSVTTWGVAVGAGSGVGSACAEDCLGICLGADVAVGNGGDVGAGVGAERIGVAEEALRAGTGGVASSAVTVACTRAASVT